MAIGRLSIDSLKHILDGNTFMPVTCVIKFYSSNCKFCHGLRGPYDILEEYFRVKGIPLRFFAFNIDDVGSLDSTIKIEGVPTIIMVKTTAEKTAQFHLMPEPGIPDPTTWYHIADVRDFIKGNL